MNTVAKFSNPVVPSEVWKISGWPLITLGEVCKISSTLIDPRDAQYANFPHVGAGNIESGTGLISNVRTAGEERLISGKFLFNENMVLYSKIRPYLEKVARPDFGGLCSADVYPLIPIRGKLTRNFLYYLLLSRDFTEYAVLGSARTGMPKVNREHLFRYCFGLPPIAEQERIVVTLDAAFRAIEQLKAVTLESLKGAMSFYASYLDKKLTDPRALWRQRTLRDVCDLISGQHIDADDYNTTGEGVPYVTGPSDFGTLNPVITKWTTKPKVSAQLNDILITVKGSGVGKLNISDIPRVVISRQIMAIRPKSDSVDFIFAFLSTKFEYFQSLATGAAIPGLSRENVQSLGIPLPPAAVQRQLMNEFQSIQIKAIALRDVYRSKLDALEELKKSLFHQAFSGNL